MGLIGARLHINEEPYEIITKKHGVVLITGLELKFDVILSDQQGLHIKWITKNIDEKVKEELEEVIRNNIKW